MKKFRLLPVVCSVACLLSLSTSGQKAFGQDPSSTSAPSLTATMRSMSSTVRQISAQYQDPAKDASTIQLADSLAGLIKSSLSFVPDSIMRLPAAQRQVRLASYQAQITQTEQTAQNLAQAVRSGDRTKATEFLKTLAGEKNQGHADFK
jgi:hypothetical protein